jgi:hypothetical protein
MLVTGLVLVVTCDVSVLPTTSSHLPERLGFGEHSQRPLSQASMNPTSTHPDSQPESWQRVVLPVYRPVNWTRATCVIAQGTLCCTRGAGMQCTDRAYPPGLSSLFRRT